MQLVIVIAKLLAVLLGANFDSDFACWESLRGGDEFQYVCMYDGSRVWDGAEMQANDARQIFVARDWDGHVVVDVDW